MKLCPTIKAYDHEGSVICFDLVNPGHRDGNSLLLFYKCQLCDKVSEGFWFQSGLIELPKKLIAGIAAHARTHGRRQVNYRDDQLN